jgi:hypothetical protein
MRAWVTLTIVATLFGSTSRPAFAAEVDAAANLEAAAQESSDDGGASATPLACDGALCDTSNGAECAVRSGAIGRASLDGECVALLSLMAAVCVSRRVSRRARRGATRPGSGARAC